MAGQSVLGRHCFWYKHSLKAVSQMSSEHCKRLPIMTHPCMSLVGKKTLHLLCMLCLKYELACMVDLLSCSKRETPGLSLWIWGSRKEWKGSVLGKSSCNQPKPQVETKLDSFPRSKWYGRTGRSHLESAPTEEHRLLLKVLLQILWCTGWMFYCCLSHCVFC